MLKQSSCMENWEKNLMKLPGLLTKGKKGLGMFTKEVSLWSQTIPTPMVQKI